MPNSAPPPRLVALERPRYFDGQLSGVDDLRAEQAYVLDRIRLRNRLLMGWGVVCGCAVTPDVASPGWVRVAPGYAVSPQGDEILIPQTAAFDLGAARTPGQETGWLAVRYAEVGARPVPGPSGEEDSRIRETYALALLPALPESHAAAKAADASWARAARRTLAKGGRHGWPVPPCPPDFDDPWVVLATIRLPAGGAAPTAADIASSDRRVLYGASAFQTLTARVASRGGA